VVQDQARVRGEAFRSSFFFHQFDAVPKGVEDMDALVPNQGRLGRVSFVSGQLDLFDDRVKVIYEKGGMGLARWTKVRLDTEMQLDISGLEPCTAAFCKVGRFRQFGEPEQADIKVTGLLFLACRHCELNMVNRKDFHISWNHRIAGSRPRIQAAEDGIDFCEAVLQEDERRTGAGMFVGSGAIGDDPLIPVIRESKGIKFNVIQGNRDRS